MFNKDSLIHKLQHYRDQNGMSQSEFAHRIGTSVSTITRWERRSSKSCPDLNQLQSIADLFGTTVWELLKPIDDGENEDSPPPNRAPWKQLEISRAYYLLLKKNGQLAILKTRFSLHRGNVWEYQGLIT